MYFIKKKCMLNTTGCWNAGFIYTNYSNQTKSPWKRTINLSISNLIFRLLNKSCGGDFDAERVFVISFVIKNILCTTEYIYSIFIYVKISSLPLTLEGN